MEYKYTLPNGTGVIEDCKPAFGDLVGEYGCDEAHRIYAEIESNQRSKQREKDLDSLALGAAFFVALPTLIKKGLAFTKFAYNQRKAQKQ